MSFAMWLDTAWTGRILTDIWPLAWAGLLGAVIGVERQWHQGLAGLRTNALVSTASAAFVRLPVATGVTDLHPANLAAFVISGIGFLGTGVILRDGMNVRGLNTAAPLWGSAAIGSYCGAGRPATATVLMLLLLVINVGLRPVVAQMDRLGARFSAGPPQEVKVSIDCLASEQATVRAAILADTKKLSLHMRGMSTVALADRPSQLRLEFDLTGLGNIEVLVERLLDPVPQMSAVCSYSWVKAESPEAILAGQHGS